MHNKTAEQRTTMQQYDDLYSEEGPGRVAARQSPPRCTKCNSPPIIGQCTNFIWFDVAL